jgi:hypothetical protein
MLMSMAEGEETVLERAFSQILVPDSYELLNVYKLYDKELELEI